MLAAQVWVLLSPPPSCPFNVPLFPRLPIHLLHTSYFHTYAQDIRFDVPLAEACFEDRQKLCATVPPVCGGEVWESVWGGGGSAPVCGGEVWESVERLRGRCGKVTCSLAGNDYSRGISP